jgi:hypothetical protein
LHVNADALSRPVLLAISNNDDLFSKSLDIYEDEAALYYLKYGKHLKGLSKQRVKRVDKLTRNYSIERRGEEEIIWYKKSDNSTQKRVPKIEERVDIIEKAHLLGHFQLETTLKRIQEKY